MKEWTGNSIRIQTQALKGATNPRKIPLALCLQHTWRGSQGWLLWSPAAFVHPPDSAHWTRREAGYSDIWQPATHNGSHVSAFGSPLLRPPKNTNLLELSVLFSVSLKNCYLEGHTEILPDISQSYKFGNLKKAVRLRSPAANSIAMFPNPLCSAWWSVSQMLASLMLSTWFLLSKPFFCTTLLISCYRSILSWVRFQEISIVASATLWSCPGQSMLPQENNDLTVTAFS